MLHELIDKNVYSVEALDRHDMKIFNILIAECFVDAIELLDEVEPGNTLLSITYICPRAHIGLKSQDAT